MLAVFEQEGQSATGDAPWAVTQAPSGAARFAAMSLAQLARLITRRMSRAELGTIWWAVVGRTMDDDMPGRPLAECAIALLEWAKGRNQLPLLIEEILNERADLLYPSLGTGSNVT